MDRDAVIAKFGDDYAVDQATFIMGIDRRLADALAARLAGRRVLETCTGAGFTTLALARVAAHVTGVDIAPRHLAMARANLERAGLAGRVTLRRADIMAPETWRDLPAFDAALLDPDWAVSGPDHVYRFRQSNTRPPADALLHQVLAVTPEVALILPPFIDPTELVDLPPHERQSLYLEGSHELYCLFFGALAQGAGPSRLDVV